MKRYYKGKKVIGVPISYKENWKYVGKWSERKVAPSKWKFIFKATKNRKAKGYGNFGKGTTGVWKIKGYQFIVKTGKGRYQTRLIGTKEVVRFKVKNSSRRYKH